MKQNRMPLHGLSARETATDLYLIILLGLFPLFPGFEGYANLTFSKFVFFAAATGLWLAALLVLSLRARGGWTRPTPFQWAALAFFAAVLLSWLCSPWRSYSLLAAGRYDGAVSSALYVLIALGVSRFTRPKTVHAAAIAIGMGLCALVGALQLFGWDPLALFPKGLNYYDANVRYSGTYLGTLGNTNVLDAAMSLSLPLFAALYVCGRGPLWLLPLAPGLFVVLRAGGGGVKLALGLTALIAAPALLTDLLRLRRALRLAALTALLAALAFAYSPVYSDGVLSVRFALRGAVWAAAGCGAVLGLLSLIPVRGFHPGPKTLRRVFLCLSLLALIGALAAAWFWPGREGTVWELHEVLHGRAQDGFGSSRMLIWRECLRLIPARPLLGGGPGTLGLRLSIEFSRAVAQTGQTLRSYVDNAHNVYFGHLVNTGVLGLAAYGTLVALALRSGLRRWGWPICLALVGALFHGLFGLGLCITEPLVWAMLGLAGAGEKEQLIP